MISFPFTPLIAYTLISMLDMSSAASIPKTRDVVSTPGIRMSSKSVGTSSAPTTLEDFQDVLYQVDIVLGGQEFRVQLDTGSTDLWVNPSAGNIKTTKVTEIPVSEAYGKGNVSGNVAFAQLEVGGFTVANQAFVLPTEINDFTFDGGNAGIMGIAFDDSSNIEAALLASGSLDSDAGATPIFNILSQNAVPSSFDIALSRANDSDSTSSGTLFIGSHDDNFSNVTQQPKLPRVAADHWTIALDKMTVNGTAFPFNQSSVSNVPSGKIAAVLDSGFSLPPLPPPAVDFIYKQIPGSVFVGDLIPDLQYIVPCTGTVDLSFTFGGVEFPVHYLDLAVVSNVTIPVNGKNTSITFCFNAYQYLTLDPTEFSGFDAILGDSFLRNAYVSFNYGQLDINGDGSFVQMIPTTDFSTALPDFQASRGKVLASLPKEMSPAAFAKLLSQSGTNGSRDRLASLMNGYLPIVIAVLAGTALASW